MFRIDARGACGLVPRRALRCRW